VFELPGSALSFESRGGVRKVIIIIDVFFNLCRDLNWGVVGVEVHRELVHCEVRSTVLSNVVFFSSGLSSS